MKIQSRSIYLALSLTLCLGLNACGNADNAPAPTLTAPKATSDLTAEFSNYLTDLADKHILPGYQNLQQQAEKLFQNSQQFCAKSSPSASDLQNLQSDWRNFTQAWQTVQWIKVGQAVQNNNDVRIQFWPDPNNAVGKGVDSLLFNTSPLTVTDLANKNVGAQGIPAMENLLFPQNDDDSLLQASNKTKRCELLQVIAENMLNVTSEIYRKWSAVGGNYRKDLIEGTGDFTSVKDSVEELVTNWLEAIEITKNNKIMYPLGTGAPGIPQLAQHPLSDESLASLATNLATFKQIFTGGGGKGFDDILISTLQQTKVAETLINNIDQAIANLNDIRRHHNSYQDALANAEGRAKLTDLMQNLRAMRDEITTGFVQALDINIGFNSNDGD